MLTDTHCHLNSSFFRDPGAVLRESMAAGVSRLVNVGVDIQTSEEALFMSDENAGVAASAGIHPHAADGAAASDISTLRKLAGNGRTSAVGETGLDFFRNYSSRENQVRLFRETIKIAKDAALPLIIHNRDSTRELLDILSGEFSGREGSPNGVIHCFSESPEYAEEFIRLNFFISFAGNITRKNADGPRRTAAESPIGRILIESDAPFMCPAPRGSRKNSPAFLTHTLRELASLRGEDPVILAETLERNSRFLFGPMDGAEGCGQNRQN